MMKEVQKTKKYQKQSDGRILVEALRNSGLCNEALSCAMTGWHGLLAIKLWNIDFRANQFKMNETGRRLDALLSLL